MDLTLIHNNQYIIKTVTNVIRKVFSYNLYYIIFLLNALFYLLVNYTRVKPGQDNSIK